MKSIDTYEISTEKLPPTNEKIKLSNKVLARLVLWGLVTFNPFTSAELSAQSLEQENLTKVEDTLKTPVLTEAQKTILIEKKLEKAGLLEIEKRHERPVIVLTTRETINNNYSDESGQIKTSYSHASESITVNLIKNGKIDIVDRSGTFIKAVLDEARLGENGLITPEAVVKLGHWKSSDYYVVLSTTQKDKMFVYESEIIDMKSGNSVVVSVEATEQTSEQALSELTQKTEKVIEDNWINNKNGKEK